MKIQHATRDGCLVVALTGRIDLASVAQVQRTVLKDLAEQPAALICDLSGLRYLDPVFAAVFATVANHPASRWPATNLLLCNAQPQVADTLRRVQAPPLLPVYDTLQQALAAARARPGVSARGAAAGPDPDRGRGRAGLRPGALPALAAGPP
jgi:anti-anti-sigma factor